MSATSAPDVSTGRYLEDHAVGQCITSEPITFSKELVEAYADAVGDDSPLHAPGEAGAVVAGPLVQAMFISWLVRDGHAAHIRGELDHTWHYTKPVDIGATVTFRVTFTRVQRSRSLARGVVHRTIEVVDRQEQVLQHATSRILVEAREAVDDAPERVGTALATPGWLQALADRLSRDEPFTTMTSTWDGTIGLAIGETTVLLRVYKGRIIEATRRTPHGATFVVHASEKTWVELVTGPANDFTARAMGGQIRMTGDAYEYLRLNRTVVGIVDVMRRLARAEEA